MSMMRQFNGGMGDSAAQDHRTGRAVNGERPPGSTSGGSPEGRFLASAGKPLSRLVTTLKERWAAALVRARSTAAALDHALDVASERRAQHRGGDRPWLLRMIIPVAVAAEALTAFVAMEALVSTVDLASGLAVMTALVGAVTACMIANRRLHRLPVPTSARIVEAAFVAVLTWLRYVSLELQSSDPTAAIGGAALAALISAIALLAIEEAVVETDTFSVFLSRLRVWFRRRQSSAAESRLASCQVQLEGTADQFQQHFLDFLLKAEGLPLAEARQRASALKAAIIQSEGSDS